MLDRILKDIETARENHYEYMRMQSFFKGQFAEPKSVIEFMELDYVPTSLKVHEVFNLKKPIRNSIDYTDYKKPIDLKQYLKPKNFKDMQTFNIRKKRLSQVDVSTVFFNKRYSTKRLSISPTVFPAMN